MECLQNRNNIIDDDSILFIYFNDEMRFFQQTAMKSSTKEITPYHMALKKFSRSYENDIITVNWP